MYHFQLLGILIAISCFNLWRRYREGRLFTPASGLHLQFLIFYGLGGLGFVLFPDAEPFLSSVEIAEGITHGLGPLVIGYSIVTGVEWYYFRRPPKKEMVITRAGRLFPQTIFIISLLGFAGHMLDGKLEIGGLSSLPTYCKHLFFPGFILAIVNMRARDSHGVFVLIVVVLMAVILGIWSPWRSVLIILAATVLMVVILLKPRLIPVTVVSGALLMGMLIPFQNAKKYDYDAFVEDPIAVFSMTFEMDVAERWESVGVFIAKRVNYMRELVYINRALDRGMVLLGGETYSRVFQQLVPRMIWSDKPEIQKWAGYNLPREVGLLQSVDVLTSWAVNSSAEAVYNFGLKCLIWFIPLLFLSAEGLERLLRRITSTPQAELLGNIALFYLYLGHTSVIFASSMIVALILIIKLLDFSLVSIGVRTRDELKARRRAILSGSSGVGSSNLGIRKA